MACSLCAGSDPFHNRSYSVETPGKQTGDNSVSGADPNNVAERARRQSAQNQQQRETVRRQPSPAPRQNRDQAGSGRQNEAAYPVPDIREETGADLPGKRNFPELLQAKADCIKAKCIGSAIKKKYSFT